MGHSGTFSHHVASRLRAVATGEENEASANMHSGSMIMVSVQDEILAMLHSYRIVFNSRLAIKTDESLFDNL